MSLWDASMYIECVAGERELAFEFQFELCGFIVGPETHKLAKINEMQSSSVRKHFQYGRAK